MRTGAYDLANGSIMHSIDDAGLVSGRDYTLAESPYRRYRCRITPLTIDAQFKIAAVLWDNNWMHTEARYYSPECLEQMKS